MERPIAFYPFLARELGSIEAALYYQQLDYWMDKGGRDDGFIYKTREEIEAETTVGSKTQQRLMKMLVEKGWLETKLLKANGVPTLHYKTLVSVKLETLKRENGFGQFDQTGLDNLTKPLTETTPKITTDTKYIVAFEEFWKLYPRKVNKKNALRAWGKLKLSEAIITTILEAVVAQSKTDQWKSDGGKYIPHPASWLNGERWNDEVKPSNGLSDQQKKASFNDFAAGNLDRFKNVKSIRV